MLRRAIGTTLVGLCAVTGPLAGSALATPDPTLTTSVSSVRPGVPFTVTSAVGCPSDQGVQSVDVTFTDSAGLKFPIAGGQTADDGNWDKLTAMLPVAGVQEDGTWAPNGEALGAGEITATCSTADSGDDPDDPSGDDGSLSGASATSSDDSDDPSGDDTGDGDDSGVTQTYSGLTFTVSANAAQVALSSTVVKPGSSLTVTPAEACSGPGSSSAELALLPVAAEADDPDPDNGDGDGTEDGDGSDVSDLPTATVATSSDGTWAPVTLALPDDLATGDYAVSVNCVDANGDLTSSYDAEALAVGTVVIGPAICGAKSVYANVTGTYEAAIIGRDDDLGTRLALTGDGPWKVKIRSEATGLVLAARTLSCTKARFDLDVPKTSVTDSGKVRARVCNTGRAPVTAILQVANGKKFKKADSQVLAAGDCDWLTGPRLDKGEKAKARVLLDAPGTSADDVASSFTVKRPKH